MSQMQDGDNQAGSSFTEKDLELSWIISLI